MRPIDNIGRVLRGARPVAYSVNGQTAPIFAPDNEVKDIIPWARTFYYRGEGGIKTPMHPVGTTGGAIKKE